MASTTTLPATSQRLQILQVIGNAIVGGMETCVERLLERLPGERFGITALCPFESPFTDRLRALGADVVIATLTEEPSWHSIQLACALVRANAIDVIQSHLPNAHVLAGIVGRLADKPVLATIHGRQMTPIDLEVHRAAGTHLAVVCRHSYLHALGVGANPKQLHLAPNGVDIDRFAPGRARSGALRRTCGIDASAPLVGFVGRLSWEKGPDVFLRMALAVRAVQADAQFVLVGEGPMAKQLEAFIDDFGLRACVRLAGMQTAMPDVLSELDVLVSSSHSEAMPLAIMEAMASGVPVVACKVGGVADLLQHGVSGWLATDGDYEGLATRVVDLLADEALRLAAGQAARARAVALFPLGKSVDTTIRLFEQLAQSRAETRRLGAVTGRRPIAAEGD